MMLLLCGPAFSFLLGRYQGVELLGCIETLCSAPMLFVKEQAPRAWQAWVWVLGLSFLAAGFQQEIPCCLSLGYLIFGLGSDPPCLFALMGCHEMQGKMLSGQEFPRGQSSLSLRDYRLHPSLLLARVLSPAGQGRSIVATLCIRDFFRIFSWASFTVICFINYRRLYSLQKTMKMPLELLLRS